MTRDGQGSASANLPMNNFRHTGVGNGVARTDYAAMGQLEDGLINWGVDSGAADTLAVSYSPAITSLVDGQLCFARALHANATTTPTFTPNGLTPRTITKSGGSALVAGDIIGALAEIVLRYNLANTRWELLNPQSVTVNTANIVAKAVTYAKIQDETTNTLLGNVSGGNAAPQEITIGTGLLVSGTTLKAPALPVPAAFKNLSIKVATNTTVAVAADFVTTTDGTNFQTTAVSATCDLGSNGAVNKLDAGTIAINTWYSIWVIVKADGTTGTLASLSATAPTLPTGYTFKARVGWVQTINGSATLYGTWQFGRRAQYVVGLAQTTVAVAMVAMSSNSGTPASGGSALALARFVPPTASVFYGAVNVTGNGSVAICAPNASYGGTGTTTNPPPVFHTNAGANMTGTTSGVPFEMLLESTNIYFASTGGGLQCSGWEDNI